MKIQKEKRDDLKLDVKGYGCWDDCSVYYANGAYEKDCGWGTSAYKNFFS